MELRLHRLDPACECVGAAGCRSDDRPQYARPRGEPRPAEGALEVLPPIALETQLLVPAVSEHVEYSNCST